MRQRDVSERNEVSPALRHQGSDLQPVPAGKPAAHEKGKPETCEPVSTAEEQPCTPAFGRPIEKESKSQAKRDRTATGLGAEVVPETIVV